MGEYPEAARRDLSHEVPLLINHCRRLRLRGRVSRDCCTLHAYLCVDVPGGCTRRRRTLRL
jgi:hypothetical protein